MVKEVNLAHWAMGALEKRLQEAEEGRLQPKLDMEESETEDDVESESSSPNIPQGPCQSQDSLCSTAEPVKVAALG